MSSEVFLRQSRRQRAEISRATDYWQNLNTVLIIYLPL